MPSATAPARPRPQPPHTIYLNRREWRVCRDPLRAARLATLLPEAAAQSAATIDYGVAILKWFYRVLFAALLVSAPIYRFAIAGDRRLDYGDTSDTWLVPAFAVCIPGAVVMFVRVGARFRRRAVAGLGWAVLASFVPLVVYGMFHDWFCGLAVMALALIAMGLLATCWAVDARSRWWRWLAIPALALLGCGLLVGRVAPPLVFLDGTAHAGAIAMLAAAVAVFVIALCAPRRYRRAGGWLAVAVLAVATVAIATAADIDPAAAAMYLAAWPGVAVGIASVVWRGRAWAAVPHELRAIEPGTLEFEHLLASTRDKPLWFPPLEGATLRHARAQDPTTTQRRRLRWIRVNGHARPALRALAAMAIVMVGSLIAFNVADEAHLVTLEWRAVAALERLDASTSPKAPPWMMHGDLAREHYTGQRDREWPPPGPDADNRWAALQRYTESVGLWDGSRWRLPTLDVPEQALPRGPGRLPHSRLWEPRTWNGFAMHRSWSEDTLIETGRAVAIWSSADDRLDEACTLRRCVYRETDSPAWVMNAWSLLEWRWEYSLLSTTVDAIPQAARKAVRQWVRWLPLIELMDSTEQHELARNLRLQAFDTLVYLTMYLAPADVAALKPRVTAAINASLSAHLAPARVRHESADGLLENLDTLVIQWGWIAGPTRWQRAMGASAVIAAERILELVAANLNNPNAVAPDLANGSLVERLTQQSAWWLDFVTRLWSDAVRVVSVVTTFELDVRQRCASWLR